MLQGYTTGVVASSPVSGVGVAVVTGHLHISTSSQPHPMPSALGSGHSLHSRSSSNSSISSTPLSQDSAHQSHPHITTATVAHSLTNSGSGHYVGQQSVSSTVVSVAVAAQESLTANSASCGVGSCGSTASAQAHSQGRQILPCF